MDEHDARNQAGPSLFDVITPDPARARRSDPETSHEAADSITEADVTRLYGLILGVLRPLPGGLTVPDIAARLNLPRDTISPRMAPMEERRYVTRGEKRIPDLEGHTRSCVVWRAVNAVRDHAGSAAGTIDGAGLGRERGE